MSTHSTLVIITIEISKGLGVQEREEKEISHDKLFT